MSMMLRRRGVEAKRRSVVFNPLTQVTALHAVWADDPSWTNPGDGNPVDSWRNQSGGGDPASTGGNRPTFDAVNAAYNNHASIHFTAASSQRLAFDIANTAIPYKLVIVGNLGNSGVAERLLGTGGTTAANHGVGDNNGGSYVFGNGANIAAGSSNHSVHVFRATLNNASSEMWIDEASGGTGTTGTGSLSWLSIGAAVTTGGAFSVFLNGDVAFVGAYDGATTSDATLSTLCDDLQTYYGTP